MADKRISELEAITGANTAADDFFLVVDTSGAVTKKISRAELNNAIERDVLSLVNIDGGTIDGTVIGGSSAAAGTFTTFTSTGIDDNAASTAITIDGSQNVGIGTAPATNLHVNSASNTILSITGGSAVFLRTKDTGGPVDGKHWDLVNDNGNVAWRFVNDANSAVSSIYNAVRSGNTVSRHEWYVGTNSEAMRLTSSGSLGLVGIGTTAPSYLLDLYKSASTVARVRNTAATGGTPSTTHGEFVIESTDANMGMEFLGSTTADQRILFSDTAAKSGQIVYNHTNNYMALYTAAAERMRITSTGDVSISGDLTGIRYFDVYNTASTSTDGAVIRLITEQVGSTATTSADILKRKNGEFRISNFDTNAAAYIAFNVGSSETLKINSLGNVGIQVSNPATTLDCTNGYIRSEGVQGGYGNAVGNFHIDSKVGTAGAAFLNWFQGTGGVNVGNGASGYGTIRAAAFTVSSDRRLKENISYFDRGLAEILQLKPATFNFINGENNQKGFIAQDVETVIPEAVGNTTMPDSNGNVDETDTYLTINNSAIIPYLVAAIKEQQTIIESLEARVAALETA